MPSIWMVVVSGPKMVEEIRKAAEDHLSSRHSIADVFQVDYNLAPVIRHDGYHVTTVQTLLTRNFGLLFADIMDEITTSFTEIIPTKNDEWTKAPAFKSILKIISRTSNRVFVGLPLCRNSEFITLPENFPTDVVKSATIIGLFPSILHPIVGRLVSNITANTQLALKYIGPICQDRLDKEELYGRDRPNDLISWLLEDARGKQRTVHDLTLRVLAVNFAAIHTTSMGVTHALYDLATYPEYVQPLREEVEAIIAKEGWTKTAIGMMYKVDSFIKESHRLNGIGAVAMTRKVLKDFTFSNGTFVPAGCLITVATSHHDEKSFVDPDQFDGFRFSKINGSDDDRVKHQMTSLGLEYNVFGYGRQACPGRFFAVNQMKAMLAYVLMTYDVKLENESRERPANHWIYTSCVPNQQANLWFRKRSV